MDKERSNPSSSNPMKDMQIQCSIKICKEIMKKYDLTDIMIVHAMGSFSAGEPVVMVIVASTRRDRGFAALRDAVERYKKEPALFKKEIYRDGSSSWIS